MDYNLNRQRYGKPEYNIDIGGRSGDVPSTMLMEKFEETDIGGNDELAYDGYVRREICDFGPDTNLFEHERRRGGVNRASAMLELRSNGHRGSADVEKPEIFLGFGGPEDRDPRGINVDPDMKQLVRQEQSRMRFIRFTPDHSDNVTGGMRSEAKVMADNQKLFKIKRDRLKIFDRQIDGRREGLRRVYSHKSDLAKQVLVQSYGDFIKDYAMNPQRRANIVSRNIIRDSAKWRSETSDQDYQIARYSQICRRAKSTTTHSRTRDAAADVKWSDADTSKSYKALGLLMSHMIRGKRIRADAADGDIDMYKSEKTQDRKNTPVARDIALILRAMTQDAEFSTSDATMTVKTAARGPRAVLARQVLYNHIAPAHHHLNAEIVYKQVKPGADTRKCKDLVITDAAQAIISGNENVLGKRGRRDVVTGRRLDTTEDDDRTESEQTVNYRALVAEKRSVKTNTAGEDFKSESDNTQIRRELNKNHRVTSTQDQETNMEFLDNTSKERLGGVHGSKYMMRFHERDGKVSSIGE
jgi:hypothetical protein